MWSGKTIERIDSEPIDPEYGGVDRGTVIVYFTDGTALEIEGHSYEEVDLSLTGLNTDDLAEREVKVSERLVEQRERERERAEWLALSCDERAAQRRAALAKQSPVHAAMSSMMADATTDMLAASRRLCGGDEMTVRLPCPRCGERQCENAPTRTLPAIEPSPPWSNMATFPVAIKVEGGTLRPQ